MPRLSHAGGINFACAPPPLSLFSQWLHDKGAENKSRHHVLSSPVTRSIPSQIRLSAVYYAYLQGFNSSTRHSSSVPIIQRTHTRNVKRSKFLGCMLETPFTSLHHFTLLPPFRDFTRPPLRV